MPLTFCGFIWHMPSYSKGRYMRRLSDRLTGADTYTLAQEVSLRRGSAIPPENQDILLGQLSGSVLPSLIGPYQSLLTIDGPIFLTEP